MLDFSVLVSVATGKFVGYLYTPSEKQEAYSMSFVELFDPEIYANTFLGETDSLTA